MVAMSICYLQSMVNTSPCKEKIFIHKIQLPASVGRAHLRWTEENRKTVRAIIPRSQEERDKPACYQRALKKWLWRERVQVLICQPLKRFDAFWEKKNTKTAETFMLRKNGMTFLLISSVAQKCAELPKRDMNQHCGNAVSQHFGVSRIKIKSESISPKNNPFQIY